MVARLKLIGILSGSSVGAPTHSRDSRLQMIGHIVETYSKIVPIFDNNNGISLFSTLSIIENC